MKKRESNFNSTKDLNASPTQSREKNQGPHLPAKKLNIRKSYQKQQKELHEAIEKINNVEINIKIKKAIKKKFEKQYGNHFVSNQTVTDNTKRSTLQQKK